MIDPQPKLIKIDDVGRCSNAACINHVKNTTLFVLDGFPGEKLCRPCTVTTVRMTRVMFIELFLKDNPSYDPRKLPVNRSPIPELIAAVARRFKISHSAAGVSIKHWMSWRRGRDERV